MAPSIVELVTCAFSVLGGSASQGTNLLPSEAIGGVVGFVKLDGWDLAILLRNTLSSNRHAVYDKHEFQIYLVLLIVTLNSSESLALFLTAPFFFHAETHYVCRHYTGPELFHLLRGGIILLRVGIHDVYQILHSKGHVGLVSEHHPLGAIRQHSDWAKRKDSLAFLFLVSIAFRFDNDTGRQHS